MAKKKMLVCGATGFIGRNLAEYFSQQDKLEVFATYHHRPPFQCPRLNWVQADLTQSKDVASCIAGMDIILQAAATSSGSKDIVNQPHIHVTENALMNSLIFRAAYEHKVSHMVFFSCSIMYNPNSTLVKEEDFNANTDIHANYFGAGWTKVYLEKMCAFFSGLGPTQYTVIRHSNIYGPHDKFDLERSHVFGASLTKILHCNDGRITVWGDGTEQRDLLYISDLINFVNLAVKKQNILFCLLNVGYGSSISISDLIKKIISISGKKIDIHYDISQPTIPSRVALDCGKSKRLFGWEPKVSLDEGILKTMDWHRSNIPIP